MSSNNYNRSIINTIIFILFAISMLLLTYDKLPFLNYASYSPSSIFTFFTAFFLILLVGYELKSYDKWIILFIIISVLHSIIAGLIFDDLNSSIQHIVTLLIGFSVFVVTRFSFERKKENLTYERILVISMIIPLFLGYLQLLNQLGLNLNFVNEITSLFAALVYEGRVQMGSSEPSWAVIHLLVIGTILISTAKKRFQKLIVFLMAILFILSFSGLGYGVLIFSLILFGLITNKYRGRVIALLISAAIVVFLVIPFIIDYFNVQGYFIARFDPRYLFSEKFLMTDQSGFVRIVFPLLGLIQFVNFPFGYGGGFFYTHFTEYLMQYFPYGYRFPEVVNYLYHPEIATSRNLFTKMLAEEGFYNFIIFIFFLIGIFRKVTGSYAKYIFCLAIALLINFDSYAFIDFWFLLGILASGYFNKDEVPTKIKKKYKLTW